MLADEPVTINGDGETSRDFCFVANAVQANILAALAPDEAQGEIYNVAVGRADQPQPIVRLAPRRAGRAPGPLRRANPPTRRFGPAMPGTARPT